MVLRGKTVTSPLVEFSVVIADKSVLIDDNISMELRRFAGVYFKQPIIFAINEGPGYIFQGDKGSEHIVAKLYAMTGINWDIACNQVIQVQI